MQIDQPVITSAAFFTALLFFDAQQGRTSSLPGHLILGVITTVGLLGLCQIGSVNTAWILVIFPFILIILGYMIKIVRGTPSKLGPYGPGGTPPLGPYGPGGTPPLGSQGLGSATPILGTAPVTR